MELLYLILALTLPWLLGSIWLRLFIPSGPLSLILGGGLLLGLLAVPILMRLVDAAGLPITFAYVGSITGILVAGGFAANRARDIAATGSAPSSLGPGVLTIWQKAFFTLLVALVSLRLLTLGLEVIWRPLFPWDATMHWATKSKVWFYSHSISAFVDNDLWLEMGGAGVFTDHHPGYPITIPLLQVWINSALGRWDESLMNLPWVLCFMALGLMFYGQARAAGTGALVAIVFTYFLLSMPLLNTHVALAGYADLFLGTCYAGAIMAFHNWSLKREPWQGALALIFAFSCLLIKNEGFFWLLTFIPALVVVALPFRSAAFFLLAGLVTTFALLWLIPGDFSLAGHSLDRLNLHYRAEALPAVVRGFTIHASWHLFAYLLMCLIPLGYVMAGKSRRQYLGIGAALSGAIGLFLILFLFTDYASGAVRFTAVGRIALQLVPSLMFLIMLLYHEASRDPDQQCLPQ